MSNFLHDSEQKFLSSDDAKPDPKRPSRCLWRHFVRDCNK